MAREKYHHLDLVCFVGPNVISSSQASSGTSVRVVRSRNVLCGKTSDKVLETDGSRVCDIAQSFLGLGKGTQVLYSTSNQRSTLCDPDNTFHTNAVSGRFSFLKQHGRGPKENTTFHSRTLVFARSPIPAPFTCCPVPPRSGDELLCDVFEVTAPLRCTLCTTLPPHGDAVLQLRPQLRHYTEPDQDFRKLTCLSMSFPAAIATERILDFDASRSSFMKDFPNCDTVRSSSSHTYCCIQCFPKHSCFPKRVSRINLKTNTLGSKTTSKTLISKSSFWIGSDNVWLAIVLDPVIQHCVQHDFTCHIAQSMFSVSDSVDCHGSTMMVPNTCRVNTGCFHSNWST